MQNVLRHRSSLILTLVSVPLWAVNFAKAELPADLAPPYILATERTLPLASPMSSDWQSAAEPRFPVEFESQHGPIETPSTFPWKRLEFLPTEPLLWQPPLASLRQPRMYVIADSLENESTRQTIDTAIGATVGLFRIRPYRWPGVEFEVDFFGVHFSRWSERHLAVAGDYRFGFPVTFRSGPWQGKIGYEHTSTHLGDDYIKTTGQFKVQYVRDEVVFGLAYRWWNQIRVYGEFGWAVYLGSRYEESPDRFAWGIEWSRPEPTGWCGQPFAALDVDLRPEQDYEPNLSLQIGWQWIPENLKMSGRLALQYYDGLSPYGQFIQQKERWYGLGVFVDF